MCMGLCVFLRVCVIDRKRDFAVAAPLVATFDVAIVPPPPVAVVRVVASSVDVAAVRACVYVCVL